MIKTAKDTFSFSPASRQAWRQWLEANFHNVLITPHQGFFTQEALD